MAIPILALGSSFVHHIQLLAERKTRRAGPSVSFTIFRPRSLSQPLARQLPVAESRPQFDDFEDATWEDAEWQ